MRRLNKPGRGRGFFLGLTAGLTVALFIISTPIFPSRRQVCLAGERATNERQPPEKIMDVIGLKPGMVVGEVGAGQGRFTVHLAARVGATGHIYANDINGRALAVLRDRCERDHIANVETILGRVDDPLFPKNALDLVFMVLTYHHLEKPAELLKNLIPSLKPGATVVVIDPDPVKDHDRRGNESTSLEEIEPVAAAAGFEIARFETFLPRDNLFILRVKNQNREPGPNNNGNHKSVIPFTVINNKTILSATVGGSRPLKVILDSGMPWDGLLIYNPDVRDSVTLVNPRSANLGGAGQGSASASIFSDSMKFSIGGVEFNNQRVVVLQNDGFKGFSSDGVVGYSLLGHYAVEVDYDRSVLILHDPEKFRADASWEAISIFFKENRIPWLETRIAVGNEEPEDLSCYIDYASSEAVELLMKTGQKFPMPLKTEDVLLGRGLSGDIHGKKGTAAKVILGSFEFAGVPAAFAPAEVRSKQQGADGVVAARLLRRFNLIFDYAHQKLYLRPNTHFGDPFEP